MMITTFDLLLYYVHPCTSKGDIFSSDSMVPSQSVTMTRESMNVTTTTTTTSSVGIAATTSCEYCFAMKQDYV